MDNLFQVGDLVRFKYTPYGIYGIVLEKLDGLDYLVNVYWFDLQKVLPTKINELKKY